MVFTGMSRLDAARAHCSGRQFGPERQAALGRFRTRHDNEESQAVRKAPISAAAYSRSSGRIRTSSHGNIQGKRVRTPTMSLHGTTRPSTTAVEASGELGQKRHPATDRSSQVIMPAPNAAQRSTRYRALRSWQLASTTSTRPFTFAKCLSRLFTDIWPLFGSDERTTGCDLFFNLADTVRQVAKRTLQQLRINHRPLAVNCLGVLELLDLLLELLDLLKIFFFNLLKILFLNDLFSDFDQTNADRDGIRTNAICDHGQL